MAAATAGGAKKGLGEILKLVPKVSFAVAYGSAVVKQVFLSVLPTKPSRVRRKPRVT